ncbi:MAG: ECF transporter S component [Bacilli bacterium]
MRKMTILYKISFSALFIALTMILSRFLSIPFYLFGLPFLKVSLAPSIVMFSSFYLGPLWGLLVGSFADILGALLAPQGGEFNPLFTIAAGLTGLMPWLVYKCLDKKLDKHFPYVLSGVLLAFDIFITIYLCLNDRFYTSAKKYYEIAQWMKITIPIVCFAISILFVVGIIFIKKKFSNRKINGYYNIYSIAASIYITYFFFKIPVSSLVKWIVLDYPFFLILASQLLLGFITCFVHTFIDTLALDISLRFSIKGSLIKNEVLLDEGNKGKQPIVKKE